MAPLIAILFPGQGSQYLGMGQGFMKNYLYSDIAEKVFKEASRTLEYDIREVLFSEEESKLNLTQYTQPAIVTVSYLCWQTFLKASEEQGLDYCIEAIAGHSLGKYSALIIAGALGLKEALLLVNKRGQFMAEGFSGQEQHYMAAIINPNIVKIEELCKEISSKYGIVVVANYNSPTQIVISGEPRAVDLAIEEIKKKGYGKARLLKVSVPSHSPLMKPASDRLKEVVDGMDFLPTKVPVISDYSVQELREPDKIKTALAEQLCNPIKWWHVIKYIMDKEVDAFVEVGPKTVLSNFLIRERVEPLVANVENPESLEKAVRALKNINIK